MKAHDDGKALDLSGLHKALRAEESSVVPVQFGKHAGRAPIAFKLCAAEGSPLWLLLAVDPSIPDDSGTVVATGPLLTMPLIEHILKDAAAGNQATR